MLKIGAFQLVYFTFLHNAEVIAYVVMAILALILLIRKPSRRNVFFFVGFLVLTILFEYQKHIVGDLAEQTVNTLYQDDGNQKLRWLTETVLYHVAPVVGWLVGWGMIGLGIWNPEWKKVGRKWRKLEAESKGGKSQKNDYNSES